MKRLVAVVLVVLLVGSFVFGVWQYTQNQRLAAENVQLKHQLDAQAAQLREAEDQKHQLEAQLNQTQSQVAELQVTINQLEQNITDLQRQLEDKALRQNAVVTVGLNFVWAPSLSSITYDAKQLSAIVHWMNDVEWKGVRIYFFIDHAGPASFMPTTDTCSSGFGRSWGPHASVMYPQNDIVVGILRGFSDGYDGCAVLNGRYLAITLSNSAAEAAGTLTHEILHLFGYTDEQLGPYSSEWSGIPLAWTRGVPVAWALQVQAHARAFAVSIPSS